MNLYFRLIRLVCDLLSQKTLKAVFSHDEALIIDYSKRYFYWARMEVAANSRIMTFMVVNRDKSEMIIMSHHIFILKP